LRDRWCDVLRGAHAHRRPGERVEEGPSIGPVGNPVIEQHARAPVAAAPDQSARKRIVGLPVLALDAWGYRIYRRPLK